MKYPYRLIKMALLPLFFSFFFMIPNTCLAYVKEGHQKIELAAYRRFKALTAENGHPDGVTMLNYLKTKYFLDNDDLPHSSYPDLSLERQFAQDRQMYHFMASNAAVLDAAELTGANAEQHDLLLHSLPDCLEMMYQFFHEMVKHPLGSRQAGRGFYVLIHIIEDSYSAEHTTRDAEGKELVTIKGWQLSRLGWPSNAKAREAGQTTMRLLHNGHHALGDDDYVGNMPDGLSPLANAAAEAVKDMLLTLYQSSNNPAQADVYLSTYFVEYFQPLKSTVQAGNFVFANTHNDTIKYNYAGAYEKDTNYVAFKYDRTPDNTFTLIGMYGFSRHPFAGYGFEFQHFIAPHAADEKNAGLVRLPLAFGFSLNEANRHSNYDFTDDLNAKAFLKTSLALPVVNKSFEPFIGINGFPFANSIRPNAILGVDFSFIPGKDFGLFGTTCGVRLALGYEHDFSGYPASNNLTLKIGFNTFASRIANGY